MEEDNGRLILKQRLEKTLMLQKTYWKHRATIRNIKFGEANTKFFQAKATIKHRNNHIAMLKDENGIEHHDHHTKAAILFKAFKERMGIAQATYNPFLLHNLINPSDSLQDLEAPFTKKEIDEVIHHMPSDKSQGPGGFNAAFLKAC